MIAKHLPNKVTQTQFREGTLYLSWDAWVPFISYSRATPGRADLARRFGGQAMSASDKNSVTNSDFARWFGRQAMSAWDKNSVTKSDLARWFEGHAMSESDKNVALRRRRLAR